MNKVYSDVVALCRRKDELGLSYTDVASSINAMNGTNHTKDSIRSIWRRYGTHTHSKSITTEVYNINKTSNWKRKVPLSLTGNSLFIGDPHAPFTHEHYLEFCRNVYDEYKCKNAFCMGDMVDQYALSLFEKEPEAYSANNELLKAIQTVGAFGKVFPNMYITVGNHDVRYLRSALKSGLPKAFLRDLGEVLEAPDTWIWNYSYILNGNIFLEHGTSSGANATIDRMWSISMNVIQGHTHSYAGVAYRNNGFSRNWAMNVGCGLDIDSYAAKYSLDRKYQPTLSCGVLVDGIPIVIPFDV